MNWQTFDTFRTVDGWIVTVLHRYSQEWRVTATLGGMQRIILPETDSHFTTRHGAVNAIMARIERRTR